MRRPNHFCAGINQSASLEALNLLTKAHARVIVCYVSARLSRADVLQEHINNKVCARWPEEKTRQKHNTHTHAHEYTFLMDKRSTHGVHGDDVRVRTIC